MSEGSEDAAILIATSYQALNRAMRTNDDKLITDCTVLVLFAGFYVESTLNHIFKSLELNIETFLRISVKSHSKTVESAHSEGKCAGLIIVHHVFGLDRIARNFF